MYIVKGGKATGTIGIGTMQEEPVRFAASELQKYLEKVVRVFIPVCAEPRNDTVILLGIDTGLEGEEFEIVSEENKVCIKGGSGLGVVYGAYHLLKKYCGIIFAGFGPEGEYVPGLDSVEIPEGTERKRPLFWYRGMQLSCVGEVGMPEMTSWREAAIRRFDWMAKNGMNYAVFMPLDVGSNNSYQQFNWKSDTEFESKFVPLPSWYTTEWLKANLLHELKKRGLKLQIGNHNFRLFMPKEIYLETHPEYFALHDGLRGIKGSQLSVCTSNKKMVEEFSKNVIKYLDENPFIDLLGIIQEDGFGMCECEECKKLDLPELDEEYERAKKNPDTMKIWGLYQWHPNKTRRLMRFVNEVIERVVKSHPNMFFDSSYYVDVSWPPADIVPHKNLRSHSTMYIRCAAHGYDDGSCKINHVLNDALVKWTNLMPGTVHIYDYYMGKSAYRSLPYPAARRIAQDWQYFRSIDLGGADIQHFAACNEAYALNTYTLARRTWDLETPFENILDDFLKGRFGSKGKDMKAIYNYTFDKLDAYGKSYRKDNVVSRDTAADEKVTRDVEKKEGCYHPNASYFFRLYSSEEVQKAISHVEKVLTGECTVRERVQLERFRAYLEFVERFRALHDKLVCKRQEIPDFICNRTIYDEMIAFMDWEKQYIETGYMAWGNDIYQWKNFMRMKQFPI